MESQNYRYYAFISYSRANENEAKWLQNKLESYRLPSVLQKQYETLPKVMKVFRDMTDITAGGRVEEALNRELQDSKKLVVVCSPESAKSEWVELEVQNFLKLGHSSDDIVTFVVDGEIDSNSERNCYTPTLHELNINAADVRVYGKQDSFIRLLAGLLGIKYEDLRQREKERRIKKGVAIGLCAAAALFILFNVWDYFFHTKVRYYADYVERNGLPEGIFEISKDKEKMSNLALRYRFEMRQGRLRRVVYENSKGAPVRHFNTESKNRPIIQEFEYEEKTKKLIKVFHKNINGNTLVLYDWPADLNYTRVNIRNEGKESQTLQASLTSINDFSETDNGSSPIRSIGYERNENGFAIKEFFYMYQGSKKPACDENGIYGFEYSLDEYGRIIEKWYLGSKGEKHSDKNGVAGRLYEYKDSALTRTIYVDSEREPVFNELCWKICDAEIDKYGNTIKECYFDESGNLVEQENGAAVWYGDYKDGLLISERFFGADSKPCLTKQGVYEMRIEYDKKGMEIKRSFFGSEGKPALFGNEGFSSYCLSYNEIGNLIQLSYFGINGEPVYNKSGYSIGRCEYNKKGNITEFTYYGLEGEPIHDGDGVFKSKLTYDQSENLTMLEFFDVDGVTPIRCKDGYAVIFKEYKDGNCIATSFFDIDGNPAINTDNVHKIVREYNEESGKPETFFYFDVGGKPTHWASGGFARRSYTFDDGGNIIGEKYFDEKGNPFFKDGYCEKRYEYENGNMTQEAFYGKDGELTNNDSGVAITKNVFDTKGNLIETHVFDSNKKAVLSSRGWAKTEFKHDEKRRVIEAKFFGIDGKTPVMLKNGFASVLYKYDSHGNKIEEVYYDVAGNKVLIKDGYASILHKYDRFGNEIEAEYYDTNGKRTLKNGNFSKVEYEYDTHSNCTSVKFYGVNDTPATNADNIHKIMREYDRLSRNTVESYFDIQNNPINANRGRAKIVQEYDNWGNVIRETYYGADGNLVNKERGFADRIVFFSDCNKSALALLYDAKEDTMIERVFDENGKAMSQRRNLKYEWKLDESGNKTELYTYYSEGPYELKNNFKFGKSFEKEEFFYKDGVLKYYNRYGSNGKKTDFSPYKEGKIDYNMKFYTNGNNKEYTSFSETGEVISVVKYDINGNPINEGDTQ